MSEPDDRHGGSTVDHTRQIARLRRIEGQVRGLQQMIENRRYCVDVAHQTDAVIAALRRVQSDMLRDHMQALVQAALTGDLPEDERRRLADEMSRLVAKVV